MTRITMICCYIILILALAYSAQAASAIPPGSFIRVEVQSVNQLATQVREDPVVGKRYASHFGVSSEYLLDYLNSEVELVTLREPLKTRVWYVDKDGRIHGKTKLLPRGTQVFASKGGTPIILWRCGNPLTSALPPVLPSKASVPLQPLTRVKAAFPEVVAIQPLVATPVDAISPVVMGALETIPAAVAAGPVAIAPVIIPSGGSAFPWLPLVAGGGGLAAVAGIGNDEGEPPPAVAPELPPTALAAVGLLSAALLGAYKRRV